MPYIEVSFEGQKTFGGFLKVDGSAQIALLDGLLIYVTPGSHYLEYSSIPAAKRAANNLNRMVGSWANSTLNNVIAAAGESHAVDATINESFDEDTLLSLEIISDAAGHVMDIPKYRMLALSDEGLQEAAQRYKEQQDIINTAVAEANGNKSPAVELVLCIFLGSLGAHRFYRGQFGMGILYLFTMGLFGIGWLVDIFKIIGRMKK